MSCQPPQRVLLRPGRRAVCLTGLALVGGSSRAGSGLRYVRPMAHDRVGFYTVDLLNTALARLGLPPLLAEDTVMSPGRIARELQEGQGRIDLMWAMAMPSTDAALVPVRFAIDRGLLGYRLLLVRAASLPRWDGLLQRPQAQWGPALAALRAGSCEHWPDTNILRANGWALRTTTGPAALFRMLATDRIDLFPRSALEILAELEAQRDLALAVLPRLAVAYPAACCVYLSPRHAALAKPLEGALRGLALDGTLPRLFDQHFGTPLRRLAVAQRQVVWLRSPFRPPALPEPPVPWLQAPAA